MTKAKTVLAHLEESDRVADIVKDANALVKKLHSELHVARETFEGLKKYQHPELIMRIPYAIKDGKGPDEKMPLSVIQMQIDRINTLLGDRA